MTSPVFNKISIIGLGLIGGSIARSAHKNKTAKIITAYDNNELALAYAKKHGFVDYTAESIERAAKDSDLIIIATPPATLENIAQEIAPHLKSGAIVMDVASVKRPAIDAISPHLPDNVIFIPAHPIAGSAQNGVQAGTDSLFINKRVIITPPTPPSHEVFTLINNFWQRMGAKLEAMPPEIHDLIYAYMSHLTQLIAFCVKQPLAEFYKYSDNNPVYKTFLRICESNPELWAEIFELNKDNILKGLDRYIDVISHVQNELKTAPENEKIGDDKELAYTVLFPRIVASCLVTTVMEAEKNAGIPFAKYAGTGFADFTSPALIPPDTDMENISTQYETVEKILNNFLLRLKQFRQALSGGSISSKNIDNR